MMVATPASVIAIIYQTGLGSYSSCSFSSHLKQSQLSMVEPPGMKRHSTRMHLQDDTSHCVSNRFTLALEMPSVTTIQQRLTTHKLNKQHVKVMSWGIDEGAILRIMRIVCSMYLEFNILCGKGHGIYVAASAGRSSFKKWAGLNGFKSSTNFVLGGVRIDMDCTNLVTAVARYMKVP